MKLGNNYRYEKWALLQHRSPLYAGILDANVKDTVSYPNLAAAFGDVLIPWESLR